MSEGKITNEDVLNFYADKGADKDYELTANYGSPSGPYKKLADTFILKGEKGEQEDIGFYNWLKD